VSSRAVQGAVQGRRVVLKAAPAARSPRHRRPNPHRRWLPLLPRWPRLPLGCRLPPAARPAPSPVPLVQEEIERRVVASASPDRQLVALESAVAAAVAARHALPPEGRRAWDRESAHSASTVPRPRAERSGGFRSKNLPANAGKVGTRCDGSSGVSSTTCPRRARRRPVSGQHLRASPLLAPPGTARSRTCRGPRPRRCRCTGSQRPASRHKASSASPTRTQSVAVSASRPHPPEE
jgi:hypothetical protein